MTTTTSRVRTDDGAELHVEIDAGPGARLNVVLVHGFTASLEEFALQRETLRGRATTVLYDCRGHGRSRRGRVRNPSIDQLGRDLGAVLDQAVPPGPVVLLGHSMGGMTIMALARQRPELFGPRVAGAFLLATSSGGLVEEGAVGLAVRGAAPARPAAAVPAAVPALGAAARALPPARHPAPARVLPALPVRQGRRDPETVTQVQALLEQTPLPVIAAFYKTLLDHDEHASLEVLHPLPVTLLVGTHDRLTPLSHSERMAEALPDAELVVVPGRRAQRQHHPREVVDEALLRLLARTEQRLAA